MNYVLGVRERAADMAAVGIAPEFDPRPADIGLTAMLEGLQRIRELAIISTAPDISHEELEQVQGEIDQTLGYVQNAAQNTDYNGAGMASAYFAVENTSLQTLGIAGLDVVNYWPDIAVIDNAISMVAADLGNARGGEAVHNEAISNEEAARIVEEYMNNVAAEISSEINALTQEIRQQEQRLSASAAEAPTPQPTRPNNGYTGISL
jgi:flagellin-like hook-associated protein FlgL